MRLGVDIGGLGPSQSGVARYLWEMLAGMLAAAPDLDVVLYSNSPVAVPLPGGRWRLRVDEGARHLPHFIWLQQRCPRLLAEDRVEAFWGQNYLLPLKLKSPCRRLLTIHDAVAVLYAHTVPRRSRLASRMHFRRAVRAADVLVADSRATARLARLCLGATEERTAVVYPGCSRGMRFFPDAQSIVAAKYGLKSPYLLTVGNIEPRKEHLTLLSALELLPQAPVLVIVGTPGWRCRRIMGEVARQQQTGRVRFLGRVADPDLACLYSAATVTVYPSFYEGFGLPVLEAMACNCPVLCSWSSSLPEVGGAAARYFRPRDVASLAEGLAAMLDDEDMLEGMRGRGVRQAARFTYEKAAVDLLRLAIGD